MQGGRGRADQNLIWLLDNNGHQSGKTDNSGHPVISEFNAEDEELDSQESDDLLSPGVIGQTHECPRTS